MWAAVPGQYKLYRDSFLLLHRNSCLDSGLQARYDFDYYWVRRKNRGGQRVKGDKESRGTIGKKPKALIEGII